MKIATKYMDYDKVMALPRPKHKKPLKPWFLLQTVIRVGSIPSLWKTRFTYEKHRMELLNPKEPVLILMNHSSFTDMKVASAIFYPKKYAIVSSVDSFVGMDWLMRLIGCIPTKKFLSDMTLIKDMEYMLKEKKTSVLMYPEAGYSFDGTTTQLPRKLGVLMKKLGVPVSMPWSSTWPPSNPWTKSWSSLLPRSAARSSPAKSTPSSAAWARLPAAA